MSEGMRAPKFLIQKVHADGSRDEPVLYGLGDVISAPDCQMGRRGFLVTSAIGLGALAALTLGCDSQENKSKSSSASEPVKAPSVLELEAKYLQGLVAHQGGINTIAFSPDGNVLASGADDTTVKPGPYRRGAW